MPVDDSWTTRDLPVLEAAVRGVDAERLTGGGVRLHVVAEQVGLSVEDVYVSARALEDAGLIEARWVMPATHGRIVAVTGEARRIVGNWPTEDVIADRLLAAATQLAEEATDDEERSRLRKLADGLAGVGRDVLVQVAGAAITGQMPRG